MTPIRVLIIDDSAVVRSVLKREISRDPELAVVGTAADPYAARDLIVSLQPDVITLDIEMPRMDGLTFLRKLMRYHPLPVVIVSSQHDLALEGLTLGAVEVMAKPSNGEGVEGIATELAERLKTAARARVDTACRHQTAMRGPLAGTDDRLIVAIGASTGGTVAIERLLRAMPANAPAILIVQHMPKEFTASFADRLDHVCSMTVAEARDGELVCSGRALIAPGNQHMLLKARGERFFVQLSDGPKVSHHRPSVDVLFRSVATEAKDHAIGVLLTGMGRDGAEGITRMREAGATTIAQDEESSVVFGMPGAAIARGGIEHVLSLSQMASGLLHLIEHRLR